MLAPDTILKNRFQIVRLLGQGGFGAVYEAIDLELKCSSFFLVFQNEYAKQAYSSAKSLLKKIKFSITLQSFVYFYLNSSKFIFAITN